MSSESLRSSENVSQNRHNQSSLGEIMKYKEDPRNNLTIGNVLNLEKRSGTRSGRTLLDIIQADSTGDCKITWTNFRHKIRLKRATAALQRGSRRSNNHANNQMMSSVPTSDPDIESQSGRIRSSSLRLQRNLSSSSNEDFSENDPTPAAREQEEEEEEEEEEEKETEGEGPPGMSLLAEKDREMGNDPAYVVEDEVDQGEVEDEVDQGEVEVENDENGDYNDCVVCMMRHKGSAFIPCGHTFCRLCSRELYVKRGNCPICNGFILEILDIF